MGILNLDSKEANHTGISKEPILFSQEWEFSIPFFLGGKELNHTVVLVKNPFSFPTDLKNWNYELSQISSQTKTTFTHRQYLHKKTTFTDVNKT